MDNKDIFWCLCIVHMAGVCLSLTVTWHLIGKKKLAVLKMKHKVVHF